MSRSELMNTTSNSVLYSRRSARYAESMWGMKFLHAGHHSPPKYSARTWQSLSTSSADEMTRSASVSTLPSTVSSDCCGHGKRSLLSTCSAASALITMTRPLASSCVTTAVGTSATAKCVRARRPMDVIERYGTALTVEDCPRGRTAPPLLVAQLFQQADRVRVPALPEHEDDDDARAPRQCHAGRLELRRLAAREQLRAEQLLVRVLTRQGVELLVLVVQPERLKVGALVIDRLLDHACHLAR
eukprot:7391867-Prymnesium_polylepis.2